MPDPRHAEGPHFVRRSESGSLSSELSTWDVWACTGPTFSYVYEQTVTLHVNHGAASLSFSDGSQVEIRKGDVLTIRKGVAADWAIPAGIENSYQTHTD